VATNRQQADMDDRGRQEEEILGGGGEMVGCLKI